MSKVTKQPPTHNCPIQGENTEYTTFVDETGKKTLGCIWCEIAKKVTG